MWSNYFKLRKTLFVEPGSFMITSHEGRNQCDKIFPTQSEAIRYAEKLTNKLDTEFEDKVLFLPTDGPVFPKDGN